MKVSVLTVTRNSSLTIRHTLDSFMTQDHEDKELLVIDGASTDDTVEIAKDYVCDQIKLISEPDRGMYDALSKGLAAYSGDAVGVLNSDDTFHDAQVLSRVAAALEHCEIVHGHVNFVDNHEAKVVRRRWRAIPRPKRGFRSGWMPAHPTFYVRREVAANVGSFDLSLAIASDYDWMLRAVELYGYSIQMIEVVMVDMMIGGRSTSNLRAYVVHNLEALQSRRKWLGVGAVDYALIAKPASKIRQWILPTEWQ